MTERNWAGNYVYRAERIHRPATVEEVASIVAVAPRVRVLGSRHSFNAIADAPELVSLADLPAEVAIDREASTVSFGGGLTYGALAAVLHEEGLALANLASLPHISVAGAVATATHGSGVANRNLASAVAGLSLITSDGELVTAARGEPDFEGFVVNLGALGAVTRLTLDVEPAYDVRQRVFEGLSWDALAADFEALMGGGYSVSLFTRWGETVDQVWVKTRVTDEPETVLEELSGAVAATVDRHPILGLETVNVTPQLGVAGLWSDRLPHFRMGFTPSSGDEIQSEYFVAREHGLGAIEAIRRIADRIRPVLQVTEVRTIAADDLWLSPQCGQDTVALHFTWRLDPEGVHEALGHVEAALAPFAPRPHWGKVFRSGAAGRYERLPDFLALRDRLDPRGAFSSDWLEAHLSHP